MFSEIRNILLFLFMLNYMIISGSVVRKGMVCIICMLWFISVLVRCEKFISVLSMKLMLLLMVNLVVVCKRLVLRFDSRWFWVIRFSVVCKILLGVGSICGESMLVWVSVF